MEEELRKIRLWASHGTIRQFRAEIEGRIAAEGYKVDLESDTIAVYRISRQGGFLGLGVRKTREPVLRVTFGAEGVTLDEASADAEFVKYLAAGFSQH